MTLAAKAEHYAGESERRSLLKKWLAKYKFKNWATTETNKTAVTPQLREERAKQIATVLSDNQRWHSHGRGISRATLESDDIKLKIDDLGAKDSLRTSVRKYHHCLSDYMRTAKEAAKEAKAEAKREAKELKEEAKADAEDLLDYLDLTVNREDSREIGNYKTLNKAQLRQLLAYLSQNRPDWHVNGTHQVSSLVPTLFPRQLKVRPARKVASGSGGFLVLIIALVTVGVIATLISIIRGFSSA